MAVSALVFAGLLVIQTPQVQTFISGKVLEKISRNIDAKIKFERIHIKPFNTLILKNIEIADKAPHDGASNTLFKAEYVIARFTLLGLADDEGLHISRAYIKNARMDLVIEEDMTNLERMFNITKHQGEKKPQGNVFDIRKVHIENLAFSMKNFRSGMTVTKGGGIDWKDLEVTDINIEARRIKLSDRVMSGTLDNMSFKEKSGFVCRSLSGSTSVGHGICKISDVRIKDSSSDLNIPSFDMLYTGTEDFKDFVNKIRINATLKSSILDQATLSYFVPGLERKTFRVSIQETVAHGTVSDLRINKFIAAALDEQIGISIDGTLKGLPETGLLSTDLKIRELKFNTEAAESLLKNFAKNNPPLISRYAPGEQLIFSGKVQGPLKSIKTEGSLISNIGKATAKLKISGLGIKKSGTSISGNIKTENLDIGAIVGSDIIRQCTLNSDFSANFDNNGPAIDIKALVIDRLNVNKYDYSRIAGAGTLKNNTFDGKIICNDPNLNFMLQGIFTLSPKTKNALYRFYANIGYADLNAMNLDKRGMSRVRFQTTANFNKIRKGDMLGNINIEGLVLENEHEKYNIGDISASSHSSNDLYRMNVSSSFASGTFTGSGSVSDFIKDFQEITLKRELPALFKKHGNEWSGRKYSLNFNFHNSMDLLSFFLPGLYIAENTTLTAQIDTSGIMQGRMKSQRIAFREQFLKDITLDFSNKNGSITGNLKSETINAVSLKLKNSNLRLFAKENHVGVGFSYDNEDELNNRGEVYMLCDLERSGYERVNYNVTLLPSRIYLNTREWSILPAEISLSGKDINIKGLQFRSGDENIRLTGGISSTAKDTLSLELSRFDISAINPLLGKDLALAGAATGKARLISDGKDKKLLLEYLCDSASISGTQLGTVRIGSKWDEIYKRFNILMNNSLNGKSSFDIRGYYSTRSKRINAEATLNKFDISFVAPFLESVFSKSSGYISGKFSAQGPPSRLNIESTDARFDDAVLKIAFTNVPYTINGGFHIDSKGVYFDSISLKDRKGNSGSVTGEINYDYFKNINFNTHINAERIECLDIDEKPGEIFYGKLNATAGIALTGPLNALKMNIDATTTGAGQLHVPIASSAKSNTSNLLTFKSEKKEVEIDPYELMVSKLKKKEKVKGDFEIKLKVAATPSVEAFVEIDKASGNVLSGHGSGIIDLDIQPSRQVFNINGDYTLSGGNYKFVAIGLAKDFSIKEGSSVRFNGNIMESTLNIDAIYKTKTSLATLIADTTSVSSRRVVECGIKITDKITNPRLQFSINVPDIDPTVKSRVESALSTDDKVQKQFLSLLMSNSFLPDEQSGIVNNSSLLTSSVSEIMSNQLNNIFQKLNIPLDLGLNYQANERGNDIFDVAVSTQLFNNRVIVNGNIGNRQYSTGRANSDVVGDIDIEIKLDKPGALRLNLFSHSADQYTNYLDNSQRNGIGLTYQQEFNSFKEFFRKLFSGRKKKEAMQREAEKAMLNEEKISVKVEKKIEENGKN